MVLGRGGQAAVFKGTIAGNPCAVKKFEGPYSHGIVRDFEALAKLSHPLVVRLLGVCEEENCLVNEFVPGGTLQHCLNDGINLSWAQRQHIAVQIVEAVGFLHKEKVVHGDLKPANVLLKPNLEVKVSDFGIARVFDTTTHFIRGTQVTRKKFTKGYPALLHFPRSCSHVWEAAERKPDADHCFFPGMWIHGS